MYKWAERLARLEDDPTDGDDQACLRVVMQLRSAYLSALTALQLVDSESAWLVTVDTLPATLQATHADRATIKGTLDDDELEDGWEQSETVPVALTLTALEQMHIMTDARCALLTNRPAGADLSRLRGTGWTPADAVVLLAEAGMFDMATTVALHHKTDLDTIVRRLADKCVQLAVEGEEKGAWLMYNESGESDRKSQSLCAHKQSIERGKPKKTKLCGRKRRKVMERKNDGAIRLFMVTWHFSLVGASTTAI